MAKIQCDLCGGELVMLVGGQKAACGNCGLEYPIERLREILMERTQINAPEAQEVDIPTQKQDTEVINAEDWELTESSQSDFVLKKQLMGGYKLVGYKGCAQRVTFPDKWTEYNDHLLFADHNEFVELIFPVGYVNAAFVSGNFTDKPNLKRVYFGGDVMLGLEDFKGCKQLQQVTVENASMIQLGAGAFADCVNLQTLHFCEEAELDIQAEVFKNCRSLKSFVAPKRSVHFAGEGIESNTFAGCVSLKDVVLPDNVKAIHKDAFKNCSSLKNVSTHSGDLQGVAIHPQAFSGSLFLPENAGLCPACGKKLRCTDNELTCSCGFSAVQYED